MWQKFVQGPESPYPRVRRACQETSSCAHPAWVFLRKNRHVDTARDTRQGFPSGGPATATFGRRGKWVGKVKSYAYWSGTAYAPNPTNNAWAFNTNDGNQNNNNQNNEFFAWAVRPGG